LHESGQYEDAGLAKLLDTYPREKLGVYTMGQNPEDWKSFVPGDAGNLSGAEIIEAVKKGRIWLNLRAVNQVLDDYSDLCGQMFSELKENTGQKTFKQDVGVLISSPKAQVFYHLDVPLVWLWQVRGTKRVWFYPPTADFAPDNCLEGVVLKETEEEFEYKSAYDEAATIIDLEPGYVATWPQMAPHRIENLDMMNVSLTVEYMSLDALAQANMLYTNGVMRRKLGANPQRVNDKGAKMWAKAIAARALKAVGGRDAFRKDKVSKFKIDLASDGCVNFYEAKTEVV